MAKSEGQHLPPPKSGVRYRNRESQYYGPGPRNYFGMELGLLPVGA
jgi:hypothetical protein